MRITLAPRLVSILVLLISALCIVYLPEVRNRAVLTENLGAYVVVLKKQALEVRSFDGLKREILDKCNGHAIDDYITLGMFLARFPVSSLKALRDHPHVAYLEMPQKARVVSESEIAKRDSATTKIPWGLDRIDQASLPLDGVYAPLNLGWGVTLYVLDTGIRVTHIDFQNRAGFVENGQKGDFVGDEFGRTLGAKDCHGHGTHVAGIAAGLSSGVAPLAEIRAARVADCRGVGHTTAALAAIDWINQNAQKPAVVLMSLDYGDVHAIKDAVDASISRGFTYVAAAGSFLRDACTVAPGGADRVITVASTDITDQQMVFDNFGPCVDILAPGKDILSCDQSDDRALKIRSGTSMAAAFVAGGAALFLESYPYASHCDVKH